MMDGSTSGPEIALIAESVANANARIRFFRIAFGASSEGQRIGRPEIRSILTDITRGGRLAIDWIAPNDLPRMDVKLAFLAIQCLETAMAFGGKINADLTGEKCAITGSATKLKIDPDLWEVLSNPQAKHQITPAQVHFALLTSELSRLKRRLSVDVQESQIRLVF